MTLWVRRASRGAGEPEVEILDTPGEGESDVNGADRCESSWGMFRVPARCGDDNVTVETDGYRSEDIGPVV